MILALLARLFSSDWKKVSFERLRQGCIDGDDDARRAFIERYECLVWGVVRGRLPRAARQDQEEVVADTFIALLQGDAALLARYEEGRGLSPEGYIRRQALMQASNRARMLGSFKRGVEVPLEPEGGGDTHPHPASGAEVLLMDQQALGELVTSLRARLTPALALTFELLFVRELEPSEVAQVLGVSLEVVYTRKRRVVVVLEELLAERAASGAT